MATKSKGKKSEQLSGFGILLDEVEKSVNETIYKTINETIEDVKQDLERQVEEIKSGRPLCVEYKDKTKVLTGLKHKNLDKLITLVGANQNVLLVGMAGTGKTKGAEQVAEALDLPFYCISVGSQTSKSDLLGYTDANGNYVATAFRNAFENGGVFVMDEIDAGNSNVLIVLNSALSNDVCAFPDKMVKKHEDFHFIATANTYGNGADRTYVGRNQLDGATLDRFTVLDWDIDEELENALVAPYKHGQAWVRAVRKLRDQVQKNGVRAIISPRMSVKGAVALELGFSSEEVIDLVVLPQIPYDRRAKMKKSMMEFRDEVEVDKGSSLFEELGW